MAPITQTFEFILFEIKNCFAFLTTLQFRGVPAIGYLIGLAVLGIALDYIFR